MFDNIDSSSDERVVSERRSTILNQLKNKYEQHMSKIIRLAPQIPGCNKFELCDQISIINKLHKKIHLEVDKRRRLLTVDKCMKTFKRPIQQIIHRYLCYEILDKVIIGYNKYLNSNLRKEIAEDQIIYLRIKYLKKILDSTLKVVDETVHQPPRKDTIASSGFASKARTKPEHRNAQQVLNKFLPIQELFDFESGGSKCTADNVRHQFLDHIQNIIKSFQRCNRESYKTWEVRALVKRDLISNASARKKTLHKTLSKTVGNHSSVKRENDQQRFDKNIKKEEQVMGKCDVFNGPQTSTASEAETESRSEFDGSKADDEDCDMSDQQLINKDNSIMSTADELYRYILYLEQHIIALSPQQTLTHIRHTYSEWRATQQPSTLQLQSAIKQAMSLKNVFKDPNSKSKHSLKQKLKDEKRKKNKSKRKGKSKNNVVCSAEVRNFFNDFTHINEVSKEIMKFADMPMVSNEQFKQQSIEDTSNLEINNKTNIQSNGMASFMINPNFQMNPWAQQQMVNNFQLNGVQNNLFAMHYLQQQQQSQYANNYFLQSNVFNPYLNNNVTVVNDMVNNTIASHHSMSVSTSIPAFDLSLSAMNNEMEDRDIIINEPKSEKIENEMVNESSHPPWKRTKLNDGSSAIANAMVVPSDLHGITDLRYQTSDIILSYLSNDEQGQNTSDLLMRQTSQVSENSFNYNYHLRRSSFDNEFLANTNDFDDYRNENGSDEFHLHLSRSHSNSHLMYSDSDIMPFP